MDQKQTKLHKPRLLVVDDEVDQCAVLEMLLSDAFEVVTATSVMAAREHPLDTFDLAIIDWHLPHENGMELAENLRQYLPQHRIFLHTADALAEHLEEDTDDYHYHSKSTAPEELKNWALHQMSRQLRSASLERDYHSGRPRLLVLNPDANQRDALRLTFENDFDVVTSNSVRGVQDTYGLQTFSASILDWHLPGESGITLARELRQFLPASCIFLHTDDPAASKYQRDLWTYAPKNADLQKLKKKVVQAIAMRMHHKRHA